MENICRNELGVAVLTYFCSFKWILLKKTTILENLLLYIVWTRALSVSGYSSWASLTAASCWFEREVHFKITEISWWSGISLNCDIWFKLLTETISCFGKTTGRVLFRGPPQALYSPLLHWSPLTKQQSGEQGFVEPRHEHVFHFTVLIVRRFVWK